jgi:type-F conjugative transfer system secretin TraK
MLMIYGSLQATQVKLVLDNQRVNLQVGVGELNRIMVEDDRIAQVFGIDGKFVVETESETGQIFINPKTKGSAYLNLITENGKTIDLNLIATESPPQTILLKLKDLKPVTAFNFNSSKDASVAVQLITAMYSMDVMPGFDIVNANKIIKSKNLHIRLTHQYIGELIGEIYTVSCKDKPIDLDEKQFLMSHAIIAIAIESPNLTQGQTKLFIVKKIEN